MKQRRLGAGGPLVSEIGLGCMGMSSAYGQRDDAESARALLRALDLGVDFFDTADMYGNGDNERLIGRVLGARRDEFTLATKFGFRAAGGGATSAAPALRVDTSPHYVAQACDASLARLGTDHIDLYYAHRRDPAVPIEDTVGAMAALVRQGKVRHLGLSEVSPQTLRAAHATHRIAAVQMEYSLFTRDVEAPGGMLDTCRQLGVALVAYSPVGRGLLTGAVTDVKALPADDFRRVVPRFADGNLEANLRLVDAVKAVADELGITAAQAALAWLLTRDELVIPIPGTKRVAYVEENTAAAHVHLSADQVARLDRAAPAGAVAGERYAESGMKLVGK